MIVRLEAPRVLQGLEVTRVNMVERRIARAAEIAAIGRPLAVSRACLTRDRLNENCQQMSGGTHDCDAPKRAPCLTHSGFTPALATRRVYANRSTLHCLCSHDVLRHARSDPQRARDGR